MKNTLPDRPSDGNEPTRSIGWSWLLSGLLSAAGLLLFSTAMAFGPGRLLCGLILLHFLPGAALARLLRRSDTLQILVFGLALSPLIVTLLVYLLGNFLLLPLHVVIGITGLLMAAALVWPRRGENQEPAARFEWPAAVPLGTGLLLVLLTAAHYLQGPSNMLNLHGLFHSTGINQIMAGLIPPDNTHLYGIASGYQWPAWIVPALSSMLMNISPPLAATISRSLTLIGLLGVGYLLARDLGQSSAGRAFSGMLTFLGMNLLGGLLYLYSLATSPNLRQMVLSGAYSPELHACLTPEFMLSHLRFRAGSIIIKLVKFSFIIPGYVAVMIAILGAVRVFRGKGKEGYLLIFLGTATGLLVHPILAVVLALPVPLALLLAQLFRRRGERFPLARLSGVALCLAMAALPALPYLLPGMESAGSGGVTSRVESGITMALVWLYFPLGLLALPAAIRAFRKRDQNVFIVLLAMTTALFLLTQQIKCDWYHLYLMSIPLGLLAGDQLGRWFHRLPSRPLRAAFATALLLLILLGPAIRFNTFFRIQRHDADRYRFSGDATITLRDRDSDLARAYDWVRRSTAREAVLVEKPKKRNYEELSALTGRRIYVGQRTPHTPWPSGDWDPLQEALDLADRLLEPGSDKSGALDRMAALPEPVYLFLHRGDQRNALPLLAAEYANLPHRVHLELDLPTVKIYRVLPLKENANQRAAESFADRRCPGASG